MKWEIRRGIDESQERINNLIRKNQICAVYDENNKQGIVQNC